MNEQTKAYFGPGEVPHGFLGLTGTGDSFIGGGAEMMVTVYHVTL